MSSFFWPFVTSPMCLLLKASTMSLGSSPSLRTIDRFVPDESSTSSLPRTLWLACILEWGRFSSSAFFFFARVIFLHRFSVTLSVLGRLFSAMNFLATSMTLSPGNITRAAVFPPGSPTCILRSGTLSFCTTSPFSFFLSFLCLSIPPLLVFGDLTTFLALALVPLCADPIPIPAPAPTAFPLLPPRPPSVDGRLLPNMPNASLSSLFPMSFGSSHASPTPVFPPWPSSSLSSSSAPSLMVCTLVVNAFRAFSSASPFKSTPLQGSSLNFPKVASTLVKSLSGTVSPSNASRTLSSCTSI
mmetsp:Transcript_8359/g.15191  ORF Transcript_8359/g.15191 Transcript_8359/m.15191 type:complete len:300 (-) Transcript_8359:467-1366(-)